MPGALAGELWSTCSSIGESCASGCLGPPARILGRSSAAPATRASSETRSGDSARSSRQTSGTSGKSFDGSSRHSKPLSVAAPSRSSNRSIHSVIAADSGAIWPDRLSSAIVKRRPGSTRLLSGPRATAPTRASSNRACSCRARCGSRAVLRRNKVAQRSNGARGGSISKSGAGTRSMRRARSSIGRCRVSSTLRNQQSASSATASPASSDRTISADTDRMPVRVSCTKARRGTRPKGAGRRTRPNRHGRKPTP